MLGLCMQDLFLRSELWDQDMIRIDLRGVLTAQTAGVLEKEFGRWFQKHAKTFVLGMQDITELSVAGAAVLTAPARRAQEEGGRVILVKPGPPVSRTLELLGILPLYPIVGSLQEILA